MPWSLINNKFIIWSKLSSGKKDIVKRVKTILPKGWGKCEVDDGPEKHIVQWLKIIWFIQFWIIKILTDGTKMFMKNKVIDVDSKKFILYKFLWNIYFS